MSVPIKGRLIALSVPRKGRLIALADRVLKAALDRPRLSAWVAGKMATEKLVRRRTAEGAWLARRGRKATVAPLYCDGPNIWRYYIIQRQTWSKLSVGVLLRIAYQPTTYSMSAFRRCSNAKIFGRFCTSFRLALVTKQSFEIIACQCRFRAYFRKQA